MLWEAHVLPDPDVSLAFALTTTAKPSDLSMRQGCSNVRLERQLHGVCIWYLIANLCIYTYTHTYIYIYTYTHMYTHTHISFM